MENILIVLEALEYLPLEVVVLFGSLSMVSCSSLVECQVVSLTKGVSFSVYILHIDTGSVLSDIWSFNISLGNWTLWGGNSSTSPGIYLNQIGEEGGWPPSRFGSATWTSDDGLLFLFGGVSGNSFSLLVLNFISHEHR